jgi:hypothetical protein
MPVRLLHYWLLFVVHDQEEQQQDEEPAADGSGASRPNKKQKAAAGPAAAAPQRQQRKAAAGAKQAVLAVLGNSNSLSAAAAADKAVRASQRAALPVDTPAPITDAQRAMVQQLASGALVRASKHLLTQLLFCRAARLVRPLCKLLQVCICMINLCFPCMLYDVQGF